ncbi:MAG: alpha/beta hydrolase [Gaiella sp.]|nr:alpha/beta hydrolase [Gaiella sp.]
MERVVLVHGSVTNGDATWVAQRPLAAEFELVVLNRPGFPPGPLVDRVDFEEHADWVVAQLRPGDHLCGHSYGGVISLFAAAHASDLRSLTVVEPPLFGLVEDRPEAAELVARLERLWHEGPREPRAFLAAFLAEVADRTVDLPDPLPAAQHQGAQILMRERAAWEAEPPLRELHDADFPKLVVRGGWRPLFDAVCRVLGERLGAEQAVVPGLLHNPQLLGEPFNDVLRDFLQRPGGTARGAAGV